jgi:hypothetical protein
VRSCRSRVPPRTTRARRFDTLGRLIEAISLCFTDDPADWLAMTSHAHALSTAYVVQNIGEVAANVGDRQRQTLHAANFSKKNACPTGASRAYAPLPPIKNSYIGCRDAPPTIPQILWLPSRRPLAEATVASRGLAERAPRAAGFACWPRVERLRDSQGAEWRTGGDRRGFYCSSRAAPCGNCAVVSRFETQNSRLVFASRPPILPVKISGSTRRRSDFVR